MTFWQLYMKYLRESYDFIALFLAVLSLAVPFFTSIIIIIFRLAEGRWPWQKEKE